MSAAEAPSLAEVATGIYRGQTRNLTRYVRAFDHACAFASDMRRDLFPDTAAAREHFLSLADRRARTDDKENI